MERVTVGEDAVEIEDARLDGGIETEHACRDRPRWEPGLGVDAERAREACEQAGNLVAIAGERLAALDQLRRRKSRCVGVEGSGAGVERFLPAERDRVELGHAVSVDQPTPDGIVGCPQTTRVSRSSGGA